MSAAIEARAIDVENINGTRYRRESGWSSKVADPSKRRAKKPYSAPASKPSIEFEIRSYDDLILALRARADELNVSREWISELAGWHSGYAGKVLSVKKIRRLGTETFGLLLDVLCAKLVLVRIDRKPLDEDKKPPLLVALQKRSKQIDRSGLIDTCPAEIKRIGLESLEILLTVFCLTLKLVPDEEALARNQHRFEERDLAHWRSATARHSKNKSGLTVWAIETECFVYRVFNSSEIAMRKILTFLIALASIAFGVCSPVAADGMAGRAIYVRNSRCI
jgi:hypothetical protein